MARGFNYAAGASDEYQEAGTAGLEKARLLELGSHKSSVVRAAIAARPDCPLGLMVTLAHDYHVDVRAAIARNASAQRTVMAYLSADRSVDVVMALLENPNLPGDLIEELSFHKKGNVRGAAAARLNAGVAAQVEAEDVHTPELAEHVVPTQMAVNGGVVVEFPTGQPMTMPQGGQAPAPPQGAPLQGAPLQAAPAPAPVAEPAIPQIFAPVSTPERQAPTRTAPVRGFKPPTT